MPTMKDDILDLVHFGPNLSTCLGLFGVDPFVFYGLGLLEFAQVLTLLLATCHDLALLIKCLSINKLYFFEM